MTLPHSALAPSGQPIWLDMARRSARATRRTAPNAALTIARHPHRRRDPQRHDRPRGLRRLDQPAAAHPGHRLRRRPAPAHGRRLARHQPPGPAPGQTCCPTAPIDHPTVRVFLAGGVPEVMLHLRALGLLDDSRADRHRRDPGRGARLVGNQRRARSALRERLLEQDGVDPDDVIMSPARAPRAGLTSTVTLPARQPRARGLGHQEHGDRPERGRSPTASTARPARPASSRASATPSPPSRDRATGRSRPATCWS